MDSVDFSVWLDRLKNLPIDAPQWEHAGAFADTLAQIIAEKELERARSNELIEAVTEIKERYSDELVFLGIDIEGTLRLPTSPPEDTRAILAMTSKLDNSLIELREAKSKTFEHLRMAAESVQSHLSTLSDALARSASLEIELGDSDPILANGDLSEDPTVNSVHTADCAFEAQASGTSTEDKGESEVPIGINELVDGSWAADKPSETLSDETQESSDVQRPESSQELDACAEQVATGNLELPSSVEEDSSKTESGEDALPHGIVETSMAAKRYLESSTLQNLGILMWSLVAEDDLSGAYWMAEYLTQESYEAAVPPVLLKAVLASRSLSPDSSRYVEDLFNIASDYSDSDVNSAQGLLEMAASLGSSIIAPHSLMLGLLKTPVACPAAGGLIAAVDEFARTGESLRPEYIEGMGESARRQDAIHEASKRAKHWLNDAPKRKYRRLMRATDVWKHLTSASGKVSEMLAPVIENDRTKAHSVNAITTEWTQEVAIDDIKQINKVLGDGKNPRPPITGRARNWLLNGIEEARGIAMTWCELVLYEIEVQEGVQKSNLIQIVRNLRNEVERQVGQVVQALSELTTEANPTEVASAGRCALRTVAQLAKTVDISVGGQIPDVPDAAARMPAIIQDAANLDSLVSRRLLWTTADGIRDDGSWSGGSLNQVVRQLAESKIESMSLEGAIERRLRSQDYRFFDVLANGLDVVQRECLTASYERARLDSELTLQDYARDMANSIDQAVRDGIIDIDDDNWITYRLAVADVEGSLDSEEDMLNFPPKFRQLESVQQGLQAEERRRHSLLADEWRKELSNVTDTTVPTIAAWGDKFEAARGSGNIRVMEECVIRLRNHSLGEPLPEPSLTDERYEEAGKALSEFVAFIENIQDVEEYASASRGLASLESRLTST